MQAIAQRLIDHLSSEKKIKYCKYLRGANVAPARFSLFVNERHPYGAVSAIRIRSPTHVSQPHTHIHPDPFSLIILATSVRERKGRRRRRKKGNARVRGRGTRPSADSTQWDTHNATSGKGLREGRAQWTAKNEKRGGATLARNPRRRRRSAIREYFRRGLTRAQFASLPLMRANK